MKELKDILTEEELELATKMAKEFADKILLDFSNQKEAIATEIKKLENEREVLDNEYKSISDYNQREVIRKKRSDLFFEVNKKQIELKNIDNQLKAITNGGNIIEFEDKVGKIYKGVPDFRNVKTDKIIFDPETILVEPAPAYVPQIDEEKFERRGAVLDAIRYTTDTYVVSYGSYEYKSNEVESKVFLVTLDQLVLINFYYLTKLKATYKKEAERKTEKSKEYYFSLPLERRERHYAQRGFYRSINKTLQKKYSEEEWDNLPLSEKEKLVPAYKVYGSEKIKSKLESNQMYSSFHDMYNVFINPEHLRYSSDKKTRLNIGQTAFGSYAHPVVFEYWRKFREMMEYKFKDIEFQRAEMSENYKTAIETSFGESNTENYLYADYGVLVKRQNGDKINASETEQIEQGLIEISKVFGNLKDEFIQNNIKISHTGKKLVFAQKAVGVYIPSMGTIAVSDKYGEIQFNSTFAHELAHFIDNKLGEKNGRRWETDNFESTAGIIAFTFRNHLNKPKEQQSDYINATKECFARAMQQYFVMQKYGDDVEIVYGYGNFSVPEKIANQEVFVNKDNFNSKIKPLIEQFLQENKDFFSAELQMKKVVEEIKETTAEIVPSIENKEILDKNFNISGKYPEKGIDFTKGIKQIFVDGVYKTKNVSKIVQKDAEKLFEYLLNGNYEGLISIRDKYVSEWKKSHSKKGTQRDRFVSIDTAKIELYNKANASIILLNDFKNKETNEIENKEVEPNELQEAIETLKILLETLPDDEKQEVEEALEVLEMLDGNSFAKGGLIAPNGNKSNLTAEQYKLVRTPEFKAWFGDWENDPESASKVVDENGEPLVVYHGTNQDFTIFDIDKISYNSGNFGHYGYGFYFSNDLKESQHYGDRVIYVFLNLKNPFTATNEQYLQLKDLGYELPDFEDKKIKIESLLGNYKNDKKTYKFINDFKNSGYELAWENLLKEKNTDAENDFYNDLSRILDYTEYGNEEGLYDYIYELLEDYKLKVDFIKGFEYQPSLHYVLDVGNLSQSFTKDIKELGYDGVIYGSEYVAFEPNQIKLADGTNTTFDPYSNDIRYDIGGSLSQGKSIEDIAKMHNISVSHIKKQLAKGKKMESEHTSNKKEQERIAKDHLVENPNYYTILEKVGL